MIFILLFVMSISLYLLIKLHYSKWQRLNIPHETPNIPYGSLLKVRQKEKPFALVLSEIYQRFCDQRFVGIFLLFKPVLLIRDVKLVRSVMINDFASFHDRGVYVDEKHDPLSANLFSLKGDLWRNLRGKLTPSFSSGKLKAMFDSVDEVANRLIEHIHGELENGKAQRFDVKSLMTTYSIDIVGSVIFGLDIDSFKNPDSEFRKITDRLYNETNILRNLRVIMHFVCPPIVTLLSCLGVNDPFTTSLRDIAKQTIEYREKHKVVRKDLLQSLIQLRNTGKISENFDDQIWSVETAANNLKHMTIDMIAANFCLFYMAGSETTSGTATFCLYELAMNPEVLKKAQLDVDQCMGKYNLRESKKFTYEALQDMKYLDLCIMETTRKYPAAPFLNRECTIDYPIEGTDFTIKKGTAIIVSLFGMHRDEKYFPSPMDFKPERFSEEKLNNNQDAYMPFGIGPRHCIAQRMGFLNAKLIVAKILANYNIAAMPRKEIEFTFHTAPVLVPNQKLQVSFSKRNTNFLC